MRKEHQAIIDEWEEYKKHREEYPKKLIELFDDYDGVKIDNADEHEYRHDILKLKSIIDKANSGAETLQKRLDIAEKLAIEAGYSVVRSPNVAWISFAEPDGSPASMSFASFQ